MIEGIGQEILIGTRILAIIGSESIFLPELLPSKRPNASLARHKVTPAVRRPFRKRFRPKKQALRGLAGGGEGNFRATQIWSEFVHRLATEWFADFCIAGSAIVSTRSGAVITCSLHQPRCSPLCDLPSRRVRFSVRSQTAGRNQLAFFRPIAKRSHSNICRQESTCLMQNSNSQLVTKGEISRVGT